MSSVRAVHHFTLYIANGRVYARNVDKHLIDLGAVTDQAGSVGYLLDGNADIAGRHLPNADAALRELEGKLDFLFLDGQFTSLPDLSQATGVSVAGAPQREIELKETASSQTGATATGALTGGLDSPLTAAPGSSHGA